MTEQADATQKPKRKYTRRAGIDKPKKRAKVEALAERAFAFFLTEENGVQLCPTGGGESFNLTAADALALAGFVERHRKALEG